MGRSSSTMSGPVFPNDEWAAAPQHRVESCSPQEDVEVVEDVPPRCSPRRVGRCSPQEDVEVVEDVVEAAAA